MFLFCIVMRYVMKEGNLMHKNNPLQIINIYLDFFDHEQAHLDTTLGMVGASIETTAHAIVAIAESADLLAACFLAQSIESTVQVVEQVDELFGRFLRAHARETHNVGEQNANLIHRVDEQRPHLMHARNALLKVLGLAEHVREQRRHDWLDHAFGDLLVLLRGQMSFVHVRDLQECVAFDCLIAYLQNRYFSTL